MHLLSVLHGVNSMYRLMVDSNWMGIVTVTVEDDTCKPRTASMCLNWNLTWQHSLDKKPGAKHMIKQRGAPFLEKKSARLAFST